MARGPVTGPFSICMVVYTACALVQAGGGARRAACALAPPPSAGALRVRLLCGPAPAQLLCALGHLLAARAVRRVVESLVEAAKAQGCYKVILDCAEANVPFYEKCGLVRKEVQMVRRAPDVVAPAPLLPKARRPLPWAKPCASSSPLPAPPFSASRRPHPPMHATARHDAGEVPVM